MKIKSLVTLSSLAVLASCNYAIMPNTSMNKAHKMAKSCSYAPLWLAPVNKDYANVNQIAKANNISKIASVSQTVYPFVIFTKTCVNVKGS